MSKVKRPVAKGLTNQQVADKLNINPRSAEHHRATISSQCPIIPCRAGTDCAVAHEHIDHHLVSADSH